jgi:hypothetical protein
VKFLATMLVVFTVLTAVMTYPQVRRLADGVHDDGDPMLLTWTLAWVAHQLPRAPARIFDANIFYPERRTLAYSETVLFPGVMAAPLFWVGLPPVLIYNIVLLSGFIVSGAGMALLVRSLTQSSGAGVLAGIAFAFLPYRLDHLPHLQLQQTQCLPFALWAFHRLLRTGRLRDGVLFGAFTAGQILSCMYYGVFLLPYLMVVCGAMLVARGRRAAGRDEAPNARRLAVALGAAAIVVCLAVLPVAIAYFGVRQVVGERGRREALDSSATWRSYLSPAETSVLYGRMHARFQRSENQLFMGFVVVGLAAACVVLPRRPGAAKSVWADPVPIAYGLGALLALDVSLGSNGLTYGALYDYVLPFRALRIPARMGLIAGFSVAVLGGCGAARIASRLPSSSARRALFVALGSLMLAEYASKPLEFHTVQRQPPQVYADIIRDRGDAPTAAIFDFPASSLDDPSYMYYSTFHWQHLVNGYSGFFPPWYQPLIDVTNQLPSDAAFAVIRQHGTRYLVVHGERLYGNRYPTLIEDLDKRSDLVLVSRHPWYDNRKHSEISAYRIVY